MFSKLFGNKKSEDDKLNSKVGKKVDSEFVPNRFRTYEFVKNEQEPEQSNNNNSVEVDYKDLDVLFAKNFTENNGKFIYCESIAQLEEKLNLFLIKFDKKKPLIWETGLLTLFKTKINLDTTIKIDRRGDDSDISISLCEGLIANEGSIMLSPIQNSVRSNPNFPDIEVIIAHRSQIFYDLEQALTNFKKKNDTRPFLIQLVDNPKQLRLINNDFVSDSKLAKDKKRRVVMLFFCDEEF